MGSPPGSPPACCEACADTHRLVSELHSILAPLLPLAQSMAGGNGELPSPMRMLLRGGKG